MKRFFLFAMLLDFVCANGYGQSWVALNGGVTQGETVVNTLAIDQTHGYLFIGGDFKYAGPLLSRNIGVWDGEKWLNREDSIGAYTFVPINAMVNLEDTIIVASDHIVGSMYGFDENPLGDINNISDGDISCLYIFHDTLYAGGDFTGGIKKWDGQHWKSVGGGISGISANVKTISEFNDELVIGGYFQYAGDSFAHSIARFDGSVWHPLGDGVINSLDFYSGHALTLANYNGYLIVGGEFDTAGAIAANDIAQWDGTTWSNPFGDGITSSPRCMFVDSTGLYVGGYIVHAGNMDMNFITRWDGISFHTVGDGLGNAVYTISRFQGNLYAGGEFSKSGNGDTVNYVAMYDISTNSWVAANLSSLSISPNPTTTSIQLHLPSNHSTTLTLFNLLGEKVKEQTMTGSDITIDVSELPAGMYVVRVGEWSGKFIKE